MAKKPNEYDYLHISARIHAMENRLLTRERMERMLSARSAEEAARRPQAAKLLDAGAVDVIAVLEGARRPGTLREVLRVQRTHGERDGVKYESRRDTASVRSRRFGWVPESRGPAPQDV